MAFETFVTFPLTAFHINIKYKSLFNNSCTVIPRLHYFEIEVMSKILSCYLSREHFWDFETENAVYVGRSLGFATSSLFHACVVTHSSLSIMAAPVDLELKKVNGGLQIYSQKLNVNIASS